MIEASLSANAASLVSDRYVLLAQRIGRLALACLHREVALEYKPGLVTPWSQGSHEDMDFSTFLRSLQSLRHYFPEIATCGCGRPDFRELRLLGIEAERQMLLATGGINTHRGAIFNLGLLCAAAGLITAKQQGLEAALACAVVRESWGVSIMASPTDGHDEYRFSHGQKVALRYGVGGARAEAAAGFPSVVAVGLPAYLSVLETTGDATCAETQALFALIASLDDTNLLWRGGAAGLAHAKRTAADFIARGGVLARDWRRRVDAIDSDFRSRRLSPGGSADLLAVTLFLARIGELG
ncbi:MAG: 2-(5''-triphosphoribosyl)-3'-dephosphocoenzyme-A synthase [Bacteroidia bacterium]|nr:2-(5''-triphosphoribosyl)-3'-dephosphocoenzyme-A synthase [Bacteroidia bacterium]RIK37039.1 MAG: triphosphoribosyl-dephospho-CoA synthase MdcB [Chloroflexota bacterium]